MKILISFSILAAVSIITLLFVMYNIHQNQNQKSNLQNDKHMNVIGWIPNWDQNNAFQSYAQHVWDFQYISVFWYNIDTNGNIVAYNNTYEDPNIITFAHQNHEKIFALVANLPDYNEQKDWDPDRVEKVISSEQARQKHISDLLQLVVSKNFDGIDIDYESLRADQRNDFSLFIKELANALHKKNKLLGVAVYPPTTDIPSQDYGLAAQDLPSLASSADQLYFMTYLEHTLSSPPGPTGGIPWITDSLNYAINIMHIPRKKIFMGIGLMGTAWKQNADGSTTGDAGDITFQDVLSIATGNNISPSWDTLSESPFLEFSDNNGNHIIWFENAQSVSRKIQLAKKLQLGGIAFWRLGGEDKAVWNLFGSNL